MRRKLINFETFDRIQKDSLSTAEHELHEAQDVLSRALGVDVSLDCFGENTVVYETVDGTYIHANYSLHNDHLTLENIEELVVDEDTAKLASRSKIQAMVESILGKEDGKAAELFSEYMSLPIVRKSLNEGLNPGANRDRASAKKAGFAKTKNAKHERGRLARQKRELDSFGSNPNKKKRVERDGLNLGGTKNKNYQKDYYKREVKGKHRPRKVFAKGGIKIKKAMKEWTTLTENVLNYVDYQTYGPVLRESVTRQDDHGNVVALRLPSTRLRNEGKILSFNWKVLNTDLKVMRETAMALAEDENFCKAVASLKKHNNLSDNDALQEALEGVISKWPNVLYLTQEELATVVSEALHAVGASNYDDDVCAFLAEGILRTAHHVLSDRVEKILRLAGSNVTTESDDSYLDFQNAVAGFYPTLDEHFQLEGKVFEDLHSAVASIGEAAKESGDMELKAEADSILADLAAIVEGEADADLELAEEVAAWIQDIVETNLTPSDWAVSNKTHMTVNGDHPDMAKKARQSYSPSGDLAGDADWQTQTTEPAFTGPKWTSVGGGDVWPSLSNPNIPKPFGDYTMKGETGVDKDATGQFGATWQSSDTWPALQNPYIPKAVTPQSYKMKNGSETDLVVDK
jgi:hypothetical protein